MLIERSHKNLSNCADFKNCLIEKSVSKNTATPDQIRISTASSNGGGQIESRISPENITVSRIFIYFSKFRKVGKRGAEEVTSRPSFRRTRAKKTRKGAENRRGVREGPREASRLVLRRLQVHSQTTFFEGWVFFIIFEGRNRLWPLDGVFTRTRSKNVGTGQKTVGK